MRLGAALTATPPIRPKLDLHPAGALRSTRSFAMPTFTKTEVGMSLSPDPDTLVTVREAAAAVKVSPQLVNWWRTSGRLKATQVDGIWRYRLGDVWDVERDTRQSRYSSRNPRNRWQNSSTSTAA